MMDGTKRIKVIVIQNWDSGKLLSQTVTNAETKEPIEHVTRIELHPETKTGRIYVKKPRPSHPALVVLPVCEVEIIEEDSLDE